MKKIILLLAFTTCNCFAQQPKRLDYSIAEIDSLSNFKSYITITDLGGSVHSEKTKMGAEKGKITISGSGYFSIRPHFYFTDSIRYSNLTNIEKRKYDYRKYCKFQRADYVRKIDYEDSGYDYVDVQFYYDNDTLFYIKSEQRTKSDDIESINSRSFFYDNIDSELADDADLKQWLVDENNEILKHCVENK